MLAITFNDLYFTTGIFCSAGGNIAISKREFPVALTAGLTPEAQN
jgi:hypothetical protein